TEYAAYCYTVQTSHQLPVRPAFPGVCVARLVQGNVRPLHVAIDPCATLARPRLPGAGSDNFAERSVFRNGEASRTQDLTHAFADLQCFGEQNKSLMGRIPTEYALVLVPREDSVLVRHDEPAGPQVAT